VESSFLSLAITLCTIELDTCYAISSSRIRIDATAMTQQMARHFFPVTTGLGKDHAPQIYEHLFPAWVAEKCPMPYANLQVRPNLM
jgi:hypothetical protein